MFKAKTHITAHELAQPSHGNEQCPVGLSRLALRSVPPMQARGKLHYMHFGRRKWFWSGLLLLSKQEVISIGAEGTKLNLGKAMETFGMERKHSPQKVCLCVHDQKMQGWYNKTHPSLSLCKQLSTMNTSVEKATCGWFLFYFILLTVS